MIEARREHLLPPLKRTRNLECNSRAYAARRSRLPGYHFLSFRCCIGWICRTHHESRNVETTAAAAAVVHRSGHGAVDAAVCILVQQNHRAQWQAARALTYCLWQGGDIGMRVASEMRRVGASNKASVCRASSSPNAGRSTKTTSSLKNIVYRSHRGLRTGER